MFTTLQCYVGSMDKVARIRASKTTLEAFALLAGCTEERVREVGYETWLRSVLARQEGILAIATVMQVTGQSLGKAKMFCGAIATNPDPMIAQIAGPLAANDSEAMQRILMEHYAFGESELAASFVRALVEAFGSPRR